jgi:antitoxin VapB
MEGVMALYVKDPEVDRMAERLSCLGRVSKTEAVRRALRRELEHVEGPSDIVERTMAFVRELNARAGPNRQLVDKAFIDSLYE